MCYARNYQSSLSRKNQGFFFSFPYVQLAKNLAVLLQLSLFLVRSCQVTVAIFTKSARYQVASTWDGKLGIQGLKDGFLPSFPRSPNSWWGSEPLLKKTWEKFLNPVAIASVTIGSGAHSTALAIFPVARCDPPTIYKARAVLSEEKKRNRGKWRKRTCTLGPCPRFYIESWWTVNRPFHLAV